MAKKDLEFLACAAVGNTQGTETTVNRGDLRDLMDHEYRAALEVELTVMAQGLSAPVLSDDEIINELYRVSVGRRTVTISPGELPSPATIGMD